MQYPSEQHSYWRERAIMEAERAGGENVSVLYEVEGYNATKMIVRYSKAGVEAPQIEISMDGFTKAAFTTIAETVSAFDPNA